MADAHPPLLSLPFRSNTTMISGVHRTVLSITILVSFSCRTSAFVHPRTHALPKPHLELSSTVEPSVPSAAAVTPKQLLPPAERQNIEVLVNERSQARWEGNYMRADEIRSAIDEITVDISWRAILSSTNTNFDTDDLPVDNLDDVQRFKVAITDVPRSEGGCSSWDLLPYAVNSSQSQKEDNVLQLAHASLGMVVSMSEQGMNVKEDELDQLVARSLDRLRVLKNRKAIVNFLPDDAGSALHGRKAADAALWFSLAGVIDNSNADICLYDELVDITTEELLRFGSNNSCRAKDILHIVERIAMSGSTGPAAHRLYNVAADFLENKISSNEPKVESRGESDEEESDCNIDYQSIIKSLRDSSFGLHSNRSLLGLWRFSTRQRKQKVFFQNAARHYDGVFKDSQIESAQSSKRGESHDQYDWSTFFKDPTKPLVIDVGTLLSLKSLYV